MLDNPFFVSEGIITVNLPITSENLLTKNNIVQVFHLNYEFHIKLTTLY